MCNTILCKFMKISNVNQLIFLELRTHGISARDKRQPKKKQCETFACLSMTMEKKTSPAPVSWHVSISIYACFNMCVCVVSVCVCQFPQHHTHIRWQKKRRQMICNALGLCLVYYSVFPSTLFPSHMHSHLHFKGLCHVVFPV